MDFFTNIFRSIAVFCYCVIRCILTGNNYFKLVKDKKNEKSKKFKFVNIVLKSGEILRYSNVIKISELIKQLKKDKFEIEKVVMKLNGELKIIEF